uniref:Ring finger protein 157 n=1 Tax=Ovis aries TaxID=9940 RepID=A0AC11DN83_SHEEP
MGALTSRQHAGVEEVDIPSNSVYRYPPKSGSYFASHFIMGGEKFDSTHPEGYLFGENSDLNFLGNRPVAACHPPGIDLGVCCEVGAKVFFFFFHTYLFGYSGLSCGKQDLSCSIAS